MSVSELVGRKFKAVRYLYDEPDAFYGLPLGTVITVCHAPVVAGQEDAVWMAANEYDSSLYEGDWGDYKHLCVASNTVEFLEFFEEVL